MHQKIEERHSLEAQTSKDLDTAFFSIENLHDECGFARCLRNKIIAQYGESFAYEGETIELIKSLLAAFLGQLARCIQ